MRRKPTPPWPPKPETARNWPATSTSLRKSMVSPRRRGRRQVASAGRRSRPRPRRRPLRPARQARLFQVLCVTGPPIAEESYSGGSNQKPRRASDGRRALSHNTQLHPSSRTARIRAIAPRAEHASDYVRLALVCRSTPWQPEKAATDGPALFRAHHADGDDASLGISGRTDGDGGGRHQRRDAWLGHDGRPD